MNRAPTAFDDEHFANPYPDGIQRHYWTAARNRMIQRAIHRLLLSKEKPLVLDIGCGRGITVDYLRNQGIEAIGCEIGLPQPISTHVAGHLHLGRDAFELDEALRQAVDLLMMLDVLEHLPEPSNFLHECSSRFPNARHVLVTVPARMELWTNYDDYYGHYFRYDMDSLQTLCAQGDYRLQRAGYFFHGLYLPAWVLARLNRDREIAIHAPGPIARPLHWLLAVCFDWEQRLLPSALPGTSWMAILRRVN